MFVLAVGRWAGGPVGRWTDGPVDRWAGGPMGRWAGGPVGRWAGGPVDRWAGGPMGRWAGGPVGRWTGGPVGRWTDGPVGRWARGRDNGTVNGTSVSRNVLSAPPNGMSTSKGLCSWLERPGVLHVCLSSQGGPRQRWLTPVLSCCLSLPARPFFLPPYDRPSRPLSHHGPPPTTVRCAPPLHAPSPLPLRTSQ